MKVLVISPSIKRSKGGVASVVRGMEESNCFLDYDMHYFSSYIDGNFIIRLIYSIFAFVKFLFIYRKYDLFHIHISSHGSTFRKIFYIRVLSSSKKHIISHIHGAQFIDFYNSLSEKKKKYVRDNLNKSDYIIALSDWRQHMFENKIGLKNCVAINNGIMLVKNAHEKIRFLSNKKFLFLGRLCERKGIYDLIYAVKKIANVCPDIKFFLAGDGDIDSVKKIIKKENLNNFFVVLGRINKEEKEELFETCGCLVLPSYNEGLPMAILESMSHGLAIISTKVGAIPEVVKDNGILFNCGNIDELCQCIRKIYESKELTMNFGEKGIKIIEEKYSEENSFHKIKELYEKISDIK